MIDFNQIEQELGVQTLMTDKQQAAIENWYRVAIKGEACDQNPDTKALGLPAAICTELARLTTLELEINVQGSQRADWINRKMQKVMSPRRRRILSVALALGSGAWKPYQAGNDIGVSFVSADSIYPISTNTDGELTEVVFVNRIQDSKNVYNRLEWMHVLLGPEDYHDKERDILEARDVAAAAESMPLRMSSPCLRRSSITATRITATAATISRGQPPIREITLSIRVPNPIRIAFKTEDRMNVPICGSRAAPKTARSRGQWLFRSFPS